MEDRPPILASFTNVFVFDGIIMVTEKQLKINFAMLFTIDAICVVCVTLFQFFYVIEIANGPANLIKNGVSELITSYGSNSYIYFIKEINDTAQFYKLILLKFVPNYSVIVK